MSDIITIDARKTDKINNLLTGKKHSIRVKRNYEYNVIEMEDVNFHFDSAVLLPDYGSDAPEPGTVEQNRITGLAVIYACYKQSEKEKFQQKILVTGHTDKKGSEQYNIKLSFQRAENIFFMLTGERSKWVESSNNKNQIEDTQQILKWISFNFQYDCDPGEKTNKMNPETSEALLKFQKRYNEDFVVKEKHKDKFTRSFIQIDEDGKIGKQTWGAFFDMYILELLIIMGIKEEGLIEIQSQLDFVKKGSGSPAPVVGCGESFPKSGSTSEEANDIDRRVEILFFDEVEQPELKCHPTKFSCKKNLCDLFNTKDVYKSIPVKVDPLPLPSGTAVRVHLKFQYKTPEEEARVFPKGFPFKLKFSDGTEEQHVLSKDDGNIFIQVLREKKSFSIHFELPETTFVAVHETGADELVSEKEVKEKIKNNYKVFNLPQKWDFTNSNWDLSPEPQNFDKETKKFINLDDLSVENIGLEGNPVKLILDPKWLHLKFTYFDRFIKKRLSIPTIVLEAFANSDKNSVNPESISNWFSSSEGCQAVHWIIQKPEKPDKKILIQFRTVKDTFIDSSGDEPKLISKQGFSENDITLNAGKAVNINFTELNADRIKYYDLPEIWKSKSYLTRQSSDSASKSEEKKFFEFMVEKETSVKRPLTFSLDDIVLYLGDETGKLLNPVEYDNSPLAVMCNTFRNKDAAGVKDSTNLTKFGLYKPESNSVFYSKAEVLTKRKDKLVYISDYPEWVRLVVLKGNMFESFYLRTPDGDTGVVGARAAVRWVDSPSLITPGNDLKNRPGIIKPRETFIIQPFFAQEHDYHGRIGRFDMILLRCCDIIDETEIAANLHYFRLHFSFNFDLTKKEKKKGRQASTLSGSDARKFENHNCTIVMDRWNGNDKENKSRARIVPKDEKFGKFKAYSLWFLQALTDSDSEKAHTKLKVFNDNAGRPFMNSKGTGELNETRVDADAHEAGHGNSLVDEYVERWRSASYRQPGFYSFSPGSPFDFDFRAMMKGNIEIRARYFWHAAEWLNKLYNTEFEVHRRTHKFHINTHPEKTKHTFISFPQKSEDNVKSGERGKYDLFLYSLGEDEYNSDVLRKTKSGKASVDPFDAILIVLVKMRFDFHTNDHTTIESGLANISSGIRDQFNQKFYASSNQLGFKHCLLHFFPRYLVKNYSGDPELKKYMGVSNKVEYSTKATSIKSQYGLHFDVETKASGDSQWTETWLDKLFGNINDLRIMLDSTVAARFPKYFAHMVGIPDGKEDDESSYEPIARKLIPDAKISKLFP